jgi:hypothetical protein
MKTCFVHIGTEKTGTTTIQNFLSKNRSRLLKQGIYYPRSPGNQNHTALAVYAMRDARMSGIRRSSGVSNAEEVPEFRDRLTTRLDRELRDSDAETILFSNEHLSSRLSMPVEIERVRDLCARYASRTVVVVYVRNQVDYLVSSFGTTIKGGSTRKFPYPLNKRRIRTMDYWTLLEAWRNAFGRENMIVRRFEPQDFVDGDLLADFAAQIPFEIGGFVRPEPRNLALGAKELAFLRAFNARVPRWIEATPNAGRGNIVAALTRCGEQGPRLSVSPEIAAGIMANFKRSNRRVSEEYFGGRFEPLFSEPQLVSDANVDLLPAEKSARPPHGRGTGGGGRRRSGLSRISAAANLPMNDGSPTYRVAGYHEVGREFSRLGEMEVYERAMG